MDCRTSPTITSVAIRTFSGRVTFGRTSTTSIRRINSPRVSMSAAVSPSSQIFNGRDRWNRSSPALRVWGNTPEKTFAEWPIRPPIHTCQDAEHRNTAFSRRTVGTREMGTQGQDAVASGAHSLIRWRIGPARAALIQEPVEAVASLERRLDVQMGGRGSCRSPPSRSAGASPSR